VILALELAALRLVLSMPASLVLGRWLRYCAAEGAA
jgi:uncharacterized protein YqiB (DUF1249 family)